jgi:hypothetical protein
MNDVSTSVKRTPVWMRIIGVAEWRHVKVTRYGGIAGNFEEKEVTYSDLRILPDFGSDAKTSGNDQSLGRFTRARSTRSLDEWLVLEFEKTPDKAAA